MNGKKARQLRKEARRVTVGAPDRAYLGRVYNKVFKQLDGTVVPYQVSTIRLDPACTRALYQSLKRQYKRRSR